MTHDELADRLEMKCPALMLSHGPCGVCVVCEAVRVLRGAVEGAETEVVCYRHARVNCGRCHPDAPTVTRAKR